MSRSSKRVSRPTSQNLGVSFLAIILIDIICILNSSSSSSSTAHSTVLDESRPKLITSSPTSRPVAASDENRIVKEASSPDVALQNISRCDPFMEEEFIGLFPPPPSFSLPPPPPFVANDCSATYSWQLVKTPLIAFKNDFISTDAGNCHNEEVRRRARHEKTTSLTNDGGQNSAKDNRAKRKKDKSSKENKTPEATNKEIRQSATVRNPSACFDYLSIDDKARDITGREGQPGQSGPPGPPGPPGQSGSNGVDGLPGLVVFSNAPAMFGVSLEGLIAYRTDVKQLFVRDHITWRPIRVAKCGDGTVDRDLSEQCDDGNDDIHDDCLGCRRSYCGDGIRNRKTEDCDGRDFGEKTCATYREVLIGTLMCTSDCQISYQRCRHKRHLYR